MFSSVTVSSSCLVEGIPRTSLVNGEISNFLFSRKRRDIEFLVLLSQTAKYRISCSLVNGEISNFLFSGKRRDITFLVLS